MFSFLNTYHFSHWRRMLRGRVTRSPQFSNQGTSSTPHKTLGPDLVILCSISTICADLRKYVCVGEGHHRRRLNQSILLNPPPASPPTIASQAPPPFPLQ